LEKLKNAGVIAKKMKLLK